MGLHPYDLLIVLGIVEVALALTKRTRSPRRRSDHGSLLTLWLVIAVSVAFAILFAMTARPGMIGPSRWLMFSSLGSFALGIALRWWAILHLGRWFTVDVAIQPEQRVVDDGPYRHIRHPSYTGLLLAFSGAGLLLGNWIAWSFIMVPITIAVLHRILIEESVLARTLGPAYTIYMSRTWRLIPFVH